jgi:hypothetical protein
MADDNDSTDTKVDDKPDTGTKADLGDAGKKALDAERKARRDAERRATDLEGRLKAIEDKDKSETERLTEENARLHKELGAATASSVRMRVALDKGLSPTQAKRLVGDTEEELTADADEILESWGAKPGEDRPTPPPGGRPREQLRPGNGDPDTPVEETDIQKLGERMFRR